MGMAASQARLLSITARLTSNELSSQLITNAKIRLATKTEEASDAYMAALNKTKLNFVYYNNNGEAQTFDLTPQLLYTYSPLKSQYSIQTANGKNMVTALDAKNYQETNSLGEFLVRYGLVTQEENDALRAEYEQEMEDYRKNMEDYWKDKADYEKDKADYLADKDKFDDEYAAYLEDYKKWLEEKDKPNLYETFSGLVGTSEAPASCYSSAKNGGLGCYTHLLDYLLYYNIELNGGSVTRPRQELTTTTGVTFTTKENGGATLDSDFRREGQSFGDNFKAISEQLPVRYCDGYDNSGYKTEGAEKYNLLEDKKQKGETITEFDRLRSDYIDNGDGTYSIKTLREKVCDMYYMIMNYASLMGDSTLRNDVLDNFTDGDMRNLGVEPTIRPKPTLRPEPEEPVPPTEPPLLAKVNDKEKGQWYVNLWYMMNGSETANLLYPDDDDTNNEWYFITHPPKASEAKQNYEVLDEGVTNDPTWIQYALDNGIVSLKKTQYTDPGENSGKILEHDADAITWQSITYKNTQDIYSTEDELAITKAQAKYEKAVKEIEAKENKYDTQLKNLDTIHNALQTEYESVKNVISKNVERSFKAFS